MTLSGRGNTERRFHSQEAVMGIGFSVFLIAVGAVLTFAIDVESSSGFNINTIGVILMVVGAIGLLVTMFVFAPRRRAAVGSTTVVERDVY